MHRRPTIDNDAECLFGFGQGMVAMCEDYTAQDYFSSTNWLLLNGTLTADATLSDDAFMDSDFGVVMDGRGDELTVAGDSLTYASYGRFSISLWFTKHECTIPGRFEYLWRHERGGWQSSSIRMYIGCASQGVGSTIEGDIVRTRLIDGDGKKVTFDWGVSAERGNGAINAEWVHVVLSVDRSAVQVFVDAKPVVDYGFEIDDWEFAWAQTEDNLAWPNGPTQLSSRLGGFPIGTSYDSRTDYFHTLELDAGVHTFNAYADYGSWHGGWFAITNSAGELLSGGEDDKPDENENSYADPDIEELQIDLPDGPDKDKVEVKPAGVPTGDRAGQRDSVVAPIIEIEGLDRSEKKPGDPSPEKNGDRLDPAKKAEG